MEKLSSELDSAELENFIHDDEYHQSKVLEGPLPFATINDNSVDKFTDLLNEIEVYVII